MRRGLHNPAVLSAVFHSDSAPVEVPVERDSSFWHVIDDALLDMKSSYLGQNAFRMFCPTYFFIDVLSDDHRSPDPRFMVRIHGSDPKAQAGRSLKPGFAW